MRVSNESENAMQDIKSVLKDDEKIEAVIFGKWGWDGYGMPEDIVEPPYGAILSESEAEKYMNGWSFHGGYGMPSCFASYIYTKNNVYFISQYDGLTSIESVPRNPTTGEIPEMPGG